MKGKVDRFSFSEKFAIVKWLMDNKKMIEDKEMSTVEVRDLLRKKGGFVDVSAATFQKLVAEAKVEVESGNPRSPFIAMKNKVAEFEQRLADLESKVKELEAWSPGATKN